jgi:hypothetical protein
MDAATNAFLLKFHAWFFLGTAVALAPALATSSAAAPYTMGTALCAVIAAWHVAFAGCCACPPASLGKRALADRRALYCMWRFGAALSVFQVVPDWFLDRGLGTLYFPADGALRIGGSVSIYMAGMWAIPVTWILAACHAPPLASAAAAAAARLSAAGAGGGGGGAEPTAVELLRAAVGALAVFGAAEELTLPLQLWHPTPKVRRLLGHTAVYVLPAEMALGAAALWAYRTSGGEGSSVARRTAAAACVSVFYTGALSVSFLCIEAQGYA